MPNKRRPNLTFIGCQVDRQLVLDLDRARKWTDRSQYIREAIAEKLNRDGIHVPEELIHPPPRGTTIMQVHSGSGHNYSLNEKPPKYGLKKKGKK